jgi:hypothetical protein
VFYALRFVLSTFCCEQGLGHAPELLDFYKKKPEILDPAALF